MLDDTDAVQTTSHGLTKVNSVKGQREMPTAH